VPLAYSRILTRRVDRERLLAQLAADSTERLDEGAYWQMFTGEDWIRMPGASRLTPEQIGTRLRRIDELATGPNHRDLHIAAVPFDDEFFLYGTPSKRFTLVGDKVTAVNTDSWCDCRRRQKIVAFEQWNDRTLRVSGTVHAAQRCRRLVRID
jgi:hypothetical protein